MTLWHGRSERGRTIRTVERIYLLIRTAFVKDGIAHIQAGAGRVADSVPAAEYIESLNKAKVLWQAKAMAEK